MGNKFVWVYNYKGKSQASFWGGIYMVFEPNNSIQVHNIIGLFETPTW